MWKLSTVWASLQTVTPSVLLGDRLVTSTDSIALQYRGNGTDIFNTQLTIDRTKNPGKRTYAANSYYRADQDQPNLTLFLATQVRPPSKLWRHEPNKVLI